MWFKTADEDRPFVAYDTVFSDFRQRRYRTVMIGNYLPYADLIGNDADVCVSFDLYKILGPSPIALAESMIVENIHIRLGFVHEAVAWPFYLAKNRYYVRMVNSIHAKAVSLHGIPGPSFAMAHYSVPHVPFIFDHDGPCRTLYRPARGGLSGYMGNLRYTDRLIGELFDAARAQPDGGPLLVLTSDHGFRGDPMLEGLAGEDKQQRTRHVPLIVVPPGETEGRVIETPFALTDLRELLTRWADTGELPAAK
jgi:hypothetical protein